MTETTTMNGSLTIGIDLGDTHSHFCVLDGAGEVLEEGRLTMTKAALRQRFESISRCRIALVLRCTPTVERRCIEVGIEAEPSIVPFRARP